MPDPDDDEGVEVTSRLTVASTSNSAEFDSGLHDFSEHIARVLSKIATNAGMSDTQVELVWASGESFVAAVQEALLESDGDARPFDAERLGGQVQAKNIPLATDGSLVRIVLDSTYASTGNPLTLFVVAHELVHPVLNRLAHQSGALADVEFPSLTPAEQARSIARGAADEYRADRVAAALLESTCTVTSAGGEPTPLDINDVLGDTYCLQFAEVLDSHVWPGWPNAVTAYRDHRLSLDGLLRRIVEDTDQTMTLLGHAQATTDEGGTDPLVDSGSHRGVSLYIADAWNSIMDAVHAWPIIPRASEAAQAFEGISEAGEAAILDMWAKLGLTFEIYPDRSYYAHVTDPQQ